MKPVIVLALARFFYSLPIGMIPTWRSLVPAAGMIGIPMALVLVQPDLGTALAIGFGGAMVMLLAGLPARWFVAGGGAAVGAAPPIGRASGRGEGVSRCRSWGGASNYKKKKT